MVYGTLQRGYSNNRVMVGPEGENASLLGKATTAQRYYMSVTGFPRVSRQLLGSFASAVDRDACYAPVRGEVWALNDEAMKACDGLEGHPKFYCRGQVPVILDKGKVALRPWMYLIVEPPRPYECLEKTPSGVLEWQFKARSGTR
jgi:gamma-glutamylcyclotransferase (GGCT)/AIG2-like uncharacterized protein YtfP